MSQQDAVSAQDCAKQAVARAAMEYVVPWLGTGAVIGVGTGSTADLFIDELAAHKALIAGTVASSERSATRLRAHGIRVVDLNDVAAVPVYIDGADEIDATLAMIKGGGGALTREKIVAAVAQTFVCIADASKLVGVLGKFPLPVEVIPMARSYVGRSLVKLGGMPQLRAGVTTDNGNLILDVRGLTILKPVELEGALDQVAGIVANGIFARRPADVLLLGEDAGVRTINRPR